MDILGSRKGYFSVYIPLLITLVIYVQVLGAGFVWDDKSFFMQWPLLRDTTHVVELLQGALPSNHRGVYRPVKSLLMMSEYQVFQENPVPYHVQAVLIHLINTLCVFVIAVLLLKRLSIAVLSATLFGVHPGLVEAVSFVTASFDTMGVSFALISYIAFLSYLTTNKTALRKGTVQLFSVICVFFAVLGFLTYEFTYVLPFFFGITSYFLFPQKKEYRLVSVSFILMGAVVILRSFLVQFNPTRGLPTSDPVVIFLSITKFFWHYIVVFVAPFHLSTIHEFVPGFTSLSKSISVVASQSISDVTTIAGIAAFAGLCIVAWKARNNHPFVSFGISWFVIGLLPVSNILPTGAVFAERYIYLPAIGLLLAGMYGIREVLEKTRGHFRQGIVGILCLVSVLFAVQTYRRVSVWRSERLLWHVAVVEHPTIVDLRNNLGVGYMREDRPEEALVQYLEAERLDPQDPRGFFNASQIYAVFHQWDRALEHARISATLAPDRTLYVNNVKEISERAHMATLSGVAQ